MPRSLFPWLAPSFAELAVVAPSPVLVRKFDEVVVDQAEPEPPPVEPVDDEPAPPKPAGRIELIKARHRLYLQRRAAERATDDDQELEAEVAEVEALEADGFVDELDELPDGGEGGADDEGDP